MVFAYFFEIIFSKISHRFNIFSIISFSRNLAKKGEMRTHIFTIFRKSFCSLDSLIINDHNFFLNYMTKVQNLFCPPMKKGHFLFPSWWHGNKHLKPKIENRHKSLVQYIRIACI